MSLRTLFIFFLIALRMHLWAQGKIAPPIHSFLRPNRSVAFADTGLESIQTVRTVIGFLFLLIANLLWSRSLSDSFERGFATAFTTPVTIALLVIACALLMVAFARRGLRKALLTQVWIPIRTVFVIAVVYAAAILIMPQINVALHASQGIGGVFGFILVIVLIFAGTGFIWAFMVSGLITLREITKHHFRAADGHPALRAIIIIAVSIWTIFTVAQNYESTLLAWNLPGHATLALVTIGPLVNVILSIVEIHRLRNAHGVSLRAPGYLLSPA